MVFKGGTLLAKGHADFYRLSEDLDFSIPISPNATRKERSDKIKIIKNHLNEICNHLTMFTITKSLTGSNESRQYNMELSYQSALSNVKGKILIEISLRDELSQQPIKILAKTLLSDPYLNERKISPFPICGLTAHEAYAEKIRAALTRKRLAIRDFFDLDYALKNKIIDLSSTDLMSIVKKKILSEKLSSSLLQEEEISNLRDKINSELIPTLPLRELNDFDLDKIISNLLTTFKSCFVEA